MPPWIEEVNQILNYHKNKDYQFKSYLAHKAGLETLEEKLKTYKSEELIDILSSLHSKHFSKHINDYEWLCFDDTGNKLKDFVKLEQGYELKRITDAKGNKFNTIIELLLNTNHDFLILNSDKETPERIFNHRTIPVYTLKEARHNIKYGFNKIADYGYVHEGYDKILAYDENQFLFNIRSYETNQYPKIEYYQDRYKTIIENPEAVLEKLPIDNMMLKFFREENLDTTCLTQSDYYVTEKNPYHVTDSLARYNMANVPRTEVYEQLNKEELEFFSYCLWNNDRRVGFYNKKPVYETKINNQSSPGYGLNRYFKKNEDFLPFLDESVSLFEEMVLTYNWIPEMVYNVFEKLCIQMKKKIKEIRCISSSTPVLTVLGKRFAHLEELCYQMNQKNATLQMGQNHMNGGFNDFANVLNFNNINNKFLYRTTDLSKNDNFENSVIKDIIAKNRMEISDLNEDEKKIFIATYEQQTNFCRITPFGEIIKVEGGKASGSPWTCIDNGKKHDNVVMVHAAKAISKEKNIEFKRSNFEILYKLVLSEEYVTHRAFSDDKITKIIPKMEKYYMSQGKTEVTLEDEIYKRMGLLIKPDKLEPWINSIFTEDNKTGLIWLGNMFKKQGSKILPVRPEAKISFGLLTINPESLVGKRVIDEEDLLISFSYRLAKLFSFMIYAVGNKPFFLKLQQIRDKIVQDVKRMYPKYKTKIEECMLDEKESKFLSLYVSVEKIGLSGKNIDIWSYEDFLKFVGEKIHMYSNPDKLKQMLSFFNTNGMNKNPLDSEYTNDFLDILNHTSFYNIKHNNKSQYSYYTGSNDNLDKKIYPFCKVNLFNLVDLLKNVPETNYNSCCDREIMLLKVEILLKTELGIQIPAVNDLNWNTVLLEGKGLKLLSEIKTEKRLFIVLPLEEDFQVFYNRAQYYKNRQFLIVEGNEYDLIPLDLRNFDVKNKWCFYRNNFVYELLKKDSVYKFRLQSIDQEDFEQQFNFYGLKYENERDKKRIKKEVEKIKYYLTRVEDRIRPYLNGDSILEDSLKVENTQDSNSFIHYMNGGPGAGKTSDMILKIKEHLKKNKKIIVMAPANEHVCNIGERLLDSKIPFAFKYSENAKKLGLISDRIRTMKKVKNPQVILMTCAMYYRKKYSSEIVMIDEASRMMILEFILLFWLDNYSKALEKIYLFGDKYQSNIFNPENINHYLYEPLTNLMREENTSYLNKTYRFGNSIVKVLNRYAYFEQPLVSQKLEDTEIKIYYTCYLFNQIHKEESEEESWFNLANIEVVKRLAEKEDYKVIVPYLSQKSKYLQQGIDAITIDSAQGREYDRVILDLTRCNAKGQAGFSDILERFVVAVSRCKKSLYLIGCEKCILNSKFKSLLDVQCMTTVKLCDNNNIKNI